MSIQKIKKVVALTTLTVFSSVTFAQAADTWTLKNFEVLEAQTEFTNLSHSEQITWPATERDQLATFSHADKITWDCPKPTQVAALN